MWLLDWFISIYVFSPTLLDLWQFGITIQICSVGVYSHTKYPRVSSFSFSSSPLSVICPYLFTFVVITRYNLLSFRQNKGRSFFIIILLLSLFLSVLSFREHVIYLSLFLSSFLFILRHWKFQLEYICYLLILTLTLKWHTHFRWKTFDKWKTKKQKKKRACGCVEQANAEISHQGMARGTRHNLIQMYTHGETEETIGRPDTRKF